MIFQGKCFLLTKTVRKLLYLPYIYLAPLLDGQQLKRFYFINSSSLSLSFFLSFFLSFIHQLYPIIPDHRYLEERHLLLAIKSVDNDESYGKHCSDHAKLCTEQYVHMCLNVTLGCVPKLCKVYHFHVTSFCWNLEVYMYHAEEV